MTINRFLGPILITCILVIGHLSYGILEGYERTGAAIATAIAAEIVLGRLTYGRIPHLASAYITGISVGILVRSPFLWAFVLASLISILSKYVLRFNGRHLWNPSNFGVSLVLLLAPSTVSLLSIQWGNTLWPMLVIWLLGTLIVWRVGRLHISAAYVGSFLLFSLVRSAITGSNSLRQLLCSWRWWAGNYKSDMTAQHRKLTSKASTQRAWQAHTCASQVALVAGGCKHLGGEISKVTVTQ